MLNDIRCDKLSTSVVTVRSCPDKYEKDFDTVVAFLTQYINKKRPAPSVQGSSVTQTRPAQWQKTSTIHGTFKEKLGLKKNFIEDYDLISMAQPTFI